MILVLGDVYPVMDARKIKQRVMTISSFIYRAKLVWVLFIMVIFIISIPITLFILPHYILAQIRNSLIHDMEYYINMIEQIESKQ